MKEKMYFLDEGSIICYPLDYFVKEELGDVDFEIFETLPDFSNPEYIWCSYIGEAGERQECKKSVCSYYESKVGEGVCNHRGRLYTYGSKVKLNKKDYE